MFIRYRQNEDGESVPIAKIYSQNEHNIKPNKLDQDTLAAIRKLQRAGYEAFLVGGAVRDLLLDRTPKDFDLATNATPRQVQRLFWNARVIGKRFKLVHLIFRDKVLEVSTFRSGNYDQKNPSSLYGTIEQDAKRRDFTLNALYFDPIKSQLWDFNDSLQDIKRRRICSIIPLEETFIEDPVRMVRALKYAAIVGFTLPQPLRRAIRRDAKELQRIAPARLSEEVLKILSCGVSHEIFISLARYELLSSILPNIEGKEITTSLQELDQNVLSSHGELAKCDQLLALTKPLLQLPTNEELRIEERFRDLYQQVKELTMPLTFANYDLEQAVATYLQSEGYQVPTSCFKAKKPVQPNRPVGSKKQRPRRKQQRP